MRFSIRGTVNAGYDALDYAISDLALLQNGNAATVFATSGPYGGLTSYSLAENGTANLVDTVFFNPGWASGISNDITLIDDGYGGAQAVIGATGATQLGAYSVSLDGTIGAINHMDGLAADLGRPQALGSTSSGQVLIAGSSGGFSGYDVAGLGLSQVFAATDTADVLVDSVSAFAQLNIDGAQILIASSDSEDGITSYRITDATLSAADVSGLDQGVGLMHPTAMATAEIGSSSYVIVASAMNANGALSVFHVAADGTLTATDHIIDTRDTRFGGAQDVEVVTAGGFTYVISGGGDDGLSLFVLLPGGQLQIIDTIEDTNSIGLSNISAIAAAAIGDTLRLLVASQSAGVLTDLAVDLSAQGVQLAANAAGGVIRGSGNDDVLVGQMGDDQLSGGAGADILVDGGGSDQLTGGAGADVFVLRDDGVEDTILDFDPAQDRLDLSSWPMFHDPASLTITTTLSGAKIYWRNETLIVSSADGQPLAADTLRAAVLQGANRPLDLSNIVFPDDHANDLTGTDGDDTLHGGPENEIIVPGRGNDTVWAGDGDDEVLGGAGRNYVYLQGGNDLFRDDAESGPDDGDFIYGGDGNDTIFAGVGDDRITGDDGEDLIYAGGGNDRAYGGAGNDEISGEGGNDILYGGPGNDRLFGGIGADRLYGNNGADVMKGGSGNDRLYGGDGADIIGGNAGNDRLFGGRGSAKLYGGQGSDTLKGGAGNDQIWGGLGDDKIYGNRGNDQLFGGGGADTFVFGKGAGHDRIVRFNPHADEIQMTGLRPSGVSLHEIKAGLLVAWGHDSVLLIGLDAGDFHIGDIDFV